MPRYKQFYLYAESLLERVIPIWLLIFPLLLYTLSPEVIGNRLSDIDTWFYYGHFELLGQYRSVDVSGAPTYYQTRLPYIIPGYVIFNFLPFQWAKIMFAYLIYGTTIISFFYVIRHHLSAKIALLAAMFFASDIYFVRTFGWNYVDSGILVYQGMTFAFLTAASKRQKNQLLWIALSAFCFTSMVFTHLGSAMLALPILGYAWFVFQFHQMRLRAFLILLGAALLGVILCQCLYGVLNVAIWDNNFFFIIEQIRIGQHEADSLSSWLPLKLLFTKGDWLAIHCAVWLASLGALIVDRLRIVDLKRFHYYCFISVFLLYAILFSLDYMRLGYFLSRDGLYASFFNFLTYMAVACLISCVSWKGAVTAVILSVSTLLIRLTYSSGGEISSLPAVATWMAALIAGAMLFLTYAFPRRGVGVIAICLFALTTIFVNWRFDRSEGIYEAHDAIKLAADGDFPRIVFDQKDPLYRHVFISTVGTFTERAWWLRGYNFPDLPLLSFEKAEKIFVLSSSIDAKAAQAAIEPQVDSIRPISFNRIQLPQGKLLISGFEVQKKLNFPGKFAEWRRLRKPIPAEALPSHVGVVEGGARVAVAPETPAGALAFGPYAQIAPGEYDVTIQYGPSDGAQKWDIMLRDVDGERVIAKGAFESTGSSNAQVNIPLTLKNPADRFQVRSIFTGQGRLTVKSIEINPRSVQ